jgi:ATP adenylyltransferase
MHDASPTPARPCPFCAPAPGRVIACNALAFAVRDAFPVTPLHTLILPHRHVSNYFGLTAGEREACAELMQDVRDAILAEDPSVEGFNVGMNAGAVAGQTIFHSHIHLIPRRPGDVENPRGGVRRVIPHKGTHVQDVCPFDAKPD